MGKKAASPVPPGYRTVTPYLVVPDGAAALDFYAKAFGAVERGRLCGPDGTTVLHAEMQIGDSVVMLTSEHPAYGSLSPLALKGTPVSIHLYVPEADVAWNRALEAGCSVRMPLADAFWGDRYGRLVDPFGHEWAVASRIEELTPAEIEARSRAATAPPPSP